mgnify:CR=1 FL=1
MNEDKVKYQVEKAIASLRLALEYGSKDLNAYELCNITEAMKNLDCLNFTMKVTNLMQKHEEKGIWKELKDRDRKSTRLNSSHIPLSRMPSTA